MAFGFRKGRTDPEIPSAAPEETESVKVVFRGPSAPPPRGVLGFEAGTVLQSFEKIRNLGSEFSQHFFLVFFDAQPDIRGLFDRAPMEPQHQAFFAALDFIMTHLREPGRLKPYLHRLGMRHVNYGAEPQHYEAVRDALLATLAHFLKDQWTDALRRQWEGALNLVVKEMREGAAAQPVTRLTEKRLPGKSEE